MSLTIFNFHGVGPVPREIDAGELDCWLEQDNFEAVLDLVRNRSDIRLTVDDGNLSDVEFILPSLLRRGLTAEFFICSARLDQPTFLTRAQVLELQSRGMTIGSHGSVHRPWRNLSPAQRSEEFGGSRAILEKLCGVKIDTAACPFGAYDRVALRELRHAGYRKVYTSDEGCTRESNWLCARTTVKRSTPLSEIKELVEHGPHPVTQALIHARSFIKRQK